MKETSEDFFRAVESISNEANAFINSKLEEAFPKYPRVRWLLKGRIASVLFGHHFSMSLNASKKALGEAEHKADEELGKTLEPALVYVDERLYSEIRESDGKMKIPEGRSGIRIDHNEVCLALGTDYVVFSRNEILLSYDFMNRKLHIGDKFEFPRLKKR